MFEDNNTGCEHSTDNQGNATPLQVIKTGKRPVGKKSEYPVIHNKFLALLPIKSLLEIQDELGLSDAQCDRHLFQALYKDKLSKLFTEYASVRAKSLPSAVRELLGDLEDQALVKAERGTVGNVALSVLNTEGEVAHDV